MNSNDTQQESKIIFKKDFRYEDFDDNNFHIQNIENNVLTDILPERDDETTFEADMYNFGDYDNMPDSDRIMECQTKGISQKRCLDI